MLIERVICSRSCLFIQRGSGAGVLVIKNYTPPDSKGVWTLIDYKLRLQLFVTTRHRRADVRSYLIKPKCSSPYSTKRLTVLNHLLNTMYEISCGDILRALADNRRPPLTVDEVLKHPKFGHTTLNLLPDHKEKVQVAKDRDGPLNIAYEVHGTGPRRFVVCSPSCDMISANRRECFCLVVAFGIRITLALWCCASLNFLFLLSLFL